MRTITCFRPSDHCHLPLQVLDLEWNRLQRLPDLGGSPKLERLNVAHNLLEDLPPLENPELYMLDVFGNRLHELPPLEALLRLSFLDAGGNYLQELPQLQKVSSSFHVLCVGDNQLQMLPDFSYRSLPASAGLRREFLSGASSDSRTVLESCPDRL